MRDYIRVVFLVGVLRCYEIIRPTLILTEHNSQSLRRFLLLLSETLGSQFARAVCTEDSEPRGSHCAAEALSRCRHPGAAGYAGELFPG